MVWGYQHAFGQTQSAVLNFQHLKVREGRCRRAEIARRPYEYGQALDGLVCYLKLIYFLQRSVLYLLALFQGDGFRSFFLEFGVPCFVNARAILPSLSLIGDLADRTSASQSRGVNL